MAIRKQLFQFNLSTWLLLMVVGALTINGIANRFKVAEMQKEIDMYREHLPALHIAIETRRLKAELKEAKRLYGDSQPIVRKLETDIRVLERKQELHSSFAKIKK